MPVLEVALITPPLLTLKYVGLLTESVWKSIWGKQGCAIWCPLQSIQNHLRYLMYHHPMQKTDNVNQYRASYQASALIESPSTVQWGTQLLLNFVSILHFDYWDCDFPNQFCVLPASTGNKWFCSRQKNR